MRDARVIFLDIDGVMNGREAQPEPQPGPVSWLSPHNIAALNTALQATGAVIVVSSTWRLSMPLTELRAAFREAGCDGEIVDVTPDLDGNDRQREIMAWLAAQAEPPRRFVVIDDFFPMPDLPGKLVKTRKLDGLTTGDLPAVLAILGE
jgi:hypothetical protein